MSELFTISAGAQALGPNAIRDILSLLSRPDVTSFAGGIPDPTLFPRDRVREAFMKASERREPDILQYGSSQGLYDLRAWIVDYLATRGVACGPDNILITSGSQQALDLATRLLVDGSEPVLVSDPSYLGALQVFRARGAVLKSLDAVPVDDRGVRLAYVVPDFANPTGATMSHSERHELIRRAADGNFAIVEDAAYCELDYDGNDDRLPSILSLDCEISGSIERTRTLYCGTFSKVLAPGLRIGWICAAGHIVETLVRQKECVDLLTSPINQAVATELVSSGYGQHVEGLRQVYGARRDAMARALTAHMPNAVEWHRPAGGMFIWLTLPLRVDTDLLLPVAVERHQVAFVPGRSFVPDYSRGNSLRLSFCQYNEARIEAGIAQLGAFLSEELESDAQECAP